MAIKPIKTGDDPVLKQKAKTVSKFDERIERLISNMLETMYDARGVGLAAPQIGISKRVIVVDTREAADSTETAATEGALYKLINPEIVDYSNEKETAVEGCLSFPGLQGPVSRSRKIVVRAQDENGDDMEFEAADLLARVIQHEIDHLNGITLVDRAEKLLRDEDMVDSTHEN